MLLLYRTMIVVAHYYSRLFSSCEIYSSLILWDFISATLWNLYHLSLSSQQVISITWNLDCFQYMRSRSLLMPLLYKTYISVGCLYYKILILSTTKPLLLLFHKTLGAFCNIELWLFLLRRTFVALISCFYYYVVPLYLSLLKRFSLRACTWIAST